MNAARSHPPEIAGFTFVRSIGGGGFADVFLYQQHRPRREVAVKVLRSEHLSEASLRQFETESDLMAEVSEHPYIVSVHAADVAADGRPYLVMEYYPGNHFGLRARGGTMSVPEVLRVGIQICAAVETAHHAGIIHRDIKPANILTSSYDRPGLTDFGIAGAIHESTATSAMGYTTGYAPPEVIGDVQGGNPVHSDVYSLGATLYSLLAGRTPFWITGGQNDHDSLTARIRAGGPPPTGRPDVPPALERLISQTLSVDPDRRPPSAHALARALQDIEQQERLATTPIELSRQVSSTSFDGGSSPSGPPSPTGQPSSGQPSSGRSAAPPSAPSQPSVPSQPFAPSQPSAPGQPAVPATDAAPGAPATPGARGDGWWGQGGDAGGAQPDATSIRPAPSPEVPGVFSSPLQRGAPTSADEPVEPPTRVGRSAPPMVTPEEPESSEAPPNRTLAIAGSVAAVVVVLGLAAIFLTSGGSDASDLPEEPSGPPNTAIDMDRPGQPEVLAATSLLRDDGSASLMVAIQAPEEQLSDVTYHFDHTNTDPGTQWGGSERPERWTGSGGTGDDAIRSFASDVEPGAQIFVADLAPEIAEPLCFQVSAVRSNGLSSNPTPERCVSPESKAGEE